MLVDWMIGAMSHGQGSEAMGRLCHCPHLHLHPQASRQRLGSQEAREDPASRPHQEDGHPWRPGQWGQATLQVLGTAWRRDASEGFSAGCWLLFDQAPRHKTLGRDPPDSAFLLQLKHESSPRTFMV